MGRTKRYSPDGIGTTLKAYKAPPVSTFKVRVTGSKETKATYDLAHRAWRLGLLDSFYFGKRGPQDATLVWMLDGVELELAQVKAHLDRAVADAGVADIAWGPAWCGYRGLVVTYQNGEVMTEAYNGHQVTESFKLAAQAA